MAHHAATPIGRLAFALCNECHDHYSQVGENVTREGITDSILHFSSEGPGLYSCPCRRCPNGTFCPAHVNLCILTCAKCGDAACANCSTDQPRIQACRICKYKACYRPACWDMGVRQIRYCMDCGAVPQCSVCAPGCKCVTCKQYMTQRW